MEVLNMRGKCETLTGPIKHCETVAALSEMIVTYLKEMSSVHEVGFGLVFFNK